MDVGVGTPSRLAVETKVDDIDKNTKGLVEAINALDGAFKVLGWVASIAKPVLWVGALIMANTSSINSELFANLVVAAQFAAYENSVARQMVTVFDAPVNAGKILQVPVWSGISAELITDESAATAKDTNTTSASITMAEHVVYHQVHRRLVPRRQQYQELVLPVCKDCSRDW